MMEMMKLLQKENGIAELLLQPTFARQGDDEPTISQAEIFADIINLSRLDVKALGEVHDVDITAKRLTPQQAALLIQGLIQNNDIQLVDIFNGIEEDREAILDATLDDERYQHHLAVKEAALYSNNGEVPDPLDPDAREMLEQQKQAAAPDPEDAMGEMTEETVDNADTDEEVTADG